MTSESLCMRFFVHDVTGHDVGHLDHPERKLIGVAKGAFPEWFKVSPRRIPLGRPKDTPKHVAAAAHVAMAGGTVYGQKGKAQEAIAPLFHSGNSGHTTEPADIANQKRVIQRHCAKAAWELKEMTDLCFQGNSNGDGRLCLYLEPNSLI